MLLKISVVQYVALGPQLKIIMNILLESKHNKLKYSLKIHVAFMFLSITVKLLFSNLSILLLVREKATMLDGPWSQMWSLVHNRGKQHEKKIKM